MRRLVVNGYGTFVGGSRGAFVLKSKEKATKVPAGDIDQIILATRGSSISAKAIRIAATHNIPILILGSGGRPVAWVSSFKSGHVKLRLAQVKASHNGKGCSLAKAIVHGKLRSQANMLKSLAKNRKDDLSKHSLLIDSASHLDKLAMEALSLDQSDIEKVRVEAVNVEAQGAKSYWEAIASILPEGIGFKGRKKKFENPDDPVNIMLNYCYGFLASEVWNIVWMSGLDPWFGFLHSESSRRPALVYDLMELFRTAVVDRVVISLATKHGGKLNSLIDVSKKRVNRDFRAELLKFLSNRLDTQVTVNGRNRTLRQHMLSQSRELARFLLGFSSSFTPFVMGW